MFIGALPFLKPGNDTVGKSSFILESIIVFISSYGISNAYSLYKVPDLISLTDIKILLQVVGRKGLEPSHLAALEPKSSVSTNSTTGPLFWSFYGDYNKKQ